ncbi:hypothetical protein AAK938_02390 [Aerococcaceae bacterium 50-4]
MKNILLDILAFTVSFILHDLLGNYIALDNLWLDFLSFLLIFVLVNIVFTRLFKD